ncbi:MAG: cysteine hydrolase family protein [Promethearchaeota archaeon]
MLGEVSFPYIGHPGSEIVNELKPEENDFVLQKNTSGTFISTSLNSFLRNMGIETVLVSGVVTNFCVHSTAREAVDYGFQTIIVEDCCAAWSEDIHSSILNSFGLIYGFILPYKKVIKRITRSIKKTKVELATH